MILAVEDNNVSQIVLEQIFIDAGNSYIIVENGQLAREMFKAERPDLVLIHAIYEAYASGPTSSKP